MDILHTQIQQRQKNNDGLLLIPGDIERDRQLINIIKTEYFFQLKRDEGKRIGVIALSGIENSWNPADIAKFQLVVTVFRAACGENNRVLGEPFGELGVIRSRLHPAVTSGHNEELFDCSGFYSIDNLVGQS